MAASCARSTIGPPFTSQYIAPPVYRSTALKFRDHYTISGRLLTHDLSSCVDCDLRRCMPSRLCI
ncbi:hypothetical protein SCLCIDRAFT_1216848 [Scleroderma citrinum Foug A]|uniref:Uncharacterized protein n=1 Tax=Scleroderma citrinum Foug A TaxID=1036808 RepID=A0A0C3DWV5_9AGAM|nr:hypothetical protein SCLCIDRAFT_1216848 [Scleroderma citrinum Foug A]